MYLIDTDIVSEKRKGLRADPGVLAFWRRTMFNEDFLPVQVKGELQRGVGMLRHRGDLPQASLLERWLISLKEEYSDRILLCDAECAHLWGQITSFLLQWVVHSLRQVRTGTESCQSQRRLDSCPRSGLALH